MSIQLQSPVLLVSLVKTEPPEETLEKEISPDIDIVYHSLSEDFIKSETVPEKTEETKYSKSLETQVFVKAENSPFIQADNTQRNKTEDTSNENDTRGASQEVIEVQGSHEHSNTLSNQETHQHLVLNSSKDLNGIGTRITKAKHPKKTNFAKCYKSVKTTSWEKDKEKIKVIKAPVIPVEAHEYTSLAKDRHVCNHCQYAYNRLNNLKLHIKQMHREVTTMYQCPYCPFMSKWSLRLHIIRKHKDTKDIQWFQCHLCEKKFKLRFDLTKHKMVHLTHEQMQDRLKLCLVCGKGFKAGFSLKKHMKFVHNIEKINKEREYTTIQSQLLEHHIENTQKKHKKSGTIKNTFIEMNSGFITQLEPPALPVSPEKSEPLVVIKNEPPESEIMEIGMDDIFNTSDSKEDIVSHTLCEGLIKSEIISKNMLETVFVKTENVKIKNIIESENLIKTEDTSDDNGQGVVEVQGNLETDEQQVLNFSNDLNGISVRSPKSKHPEKTDFAECYRTRETTSSEEVKATIKVIKAPVISVKPHEYITLAKNKHVCNHCQLTCKKLHALKAHIRTKHREVTTMYQCLYCSFKSKWRPSLRMHIHKHKGTRDNLQYYYCDKCDYYTYNTGNLKYHKLIHLKPEEIHYFYCYHCPFKSKQKGHLKTHILRHLQREEIKFDCYICDFMTLKRHVIIKHLKKHFKHRTKSDEAKCKYQLENHTEIRYHYCNKCNYKTDTHKNLIRHKIIHLKPEEIQYFYCYHCSYKSVQKVNLKRHIFGHFKKEEIKFHCYICNFMTLKREAIIEHIKKHSKVQIKSEVNEGS